MPCARILGTGLRPLRPPSIARSSMERVRRKVAAALAAGALLCAQPVLAATKGAAHAPAEKPVRLRHAIAMAVNGQELPRDPSPRIVGKGGGRLVVPVVRIYGALGIGVS